MALCALVCPSCKAPVECFDEHAREGWCPYCGCKIVDIEAARAAYAASAVHADVLRSAREHVEMGNRDEALRYARRYLSACPKSFDGYMTLLDALMLASPQCVEVVGAEFDKLKDAFVHAGVCVETAEHVSRLSDAGARLRSYLDAARGAAEKQHAQAERDARELKARIPDAEKRIAECQKAYDAIEVGEWRPKDPFEHGLGGALMEWSRGINNRAIEAAQVRKSEAWNELCSARGKLERLRDECSEASKKALVRKLEAEMLSDYDEWLNV